MLTIEPSLKRAGVGQRVLDFALRTARDTYACGGAECFVVSVKPWLQQWRVPRDGGGGRERGAVRRALTARARVRACVHAGAD